MEKRKNGATLAKVAPQVAVRCYRPSLLGEPEGPTTDQWRGGDHEGAALRAGDGLDVALPELGAEYVLAAGRRGVARVEVLVRAPRPAADLRRGANLNDRPLVDPVGETAQDRRRGAVILGRPPRLIVEGFVRIDLALEGVVDRPVRRWDRSGARGVRRFPGAFVARAGFVPVGRVIGPRKVRT